MDDQKRAYTTIFDSARKNTGGIVFIDAPGVTGKTFVINLLLASVRKQKCVALAVASSGIAATLLDSGRMAHSTFKLPLNLNHAETPVCNIKKETALADILRMYRLIVWDECTMLHKAAFEALDITLKDIREKSSIMGGVTFVMAGDFRQTLPVISYGTHADEIRACVKSSHLWRHVTKFTLSTNMKVHLFGDRHAGVFSSRLLLLGNGKVTPDSDGLIEMKRIGTVVNSEEELLRSVFPDLAQKFRDQQWLCDRAVLALLNVSVRDIILKMLQQIPGAVQVNKSINTVPDSSVAVQYPVEFLNSLELPGVPPHRLELKIGPPIILLRNLDPPKL